MNHFQLAGGVLCRTGQLWRAGDPVRQSRHWPVTDAPVPDLRAALAGDFSSSSYTLSDMAADTVGLLDVLGFDSAHITELVHRAEAITATA